MLLFYGKREIFSCGHSLTTVFILALLLSSCWFQVSERQPLIAKPIGLEINEGFDRPLGFYDDSPRFTWQLPNEKNIHSQSRYHIVVASAPTLLPNKPDLWDSQIINTGDTTFIAYEGESLSSRQQVYWQVRYWDQDQRMSEWSDISHFELGLLSKDDWQAKWIQIDIDKPADINEFGTPIHIPQYLRTQFSADKPIKKARLYITAKGVFEAYINGKRVGNDVLTPGYTPYKKRIETLTYDVTDQLIAGENAIGITLAEGWYAGRFGPQRHWHKKLAVAPKAIAQLEIEYLDGSKNNLITDENWRATQQGPLRFSGLYDGEHYNANYELFDENGDWHQIGYDAGKWLPVKTYELEADVKLQPKRHSAVKNKQEIPSLIVSTFNGKAIFDLGQNMVGVPKIKVPMLQGHALKMRFAEGINHDGSLYTKNLGSAKQLDTYIAKQDGEIEWQPQFTFHGFRYVELDGFDPSIKPDPSWVTGVVQHSDFEFDGEFSSSSAALNQLQSNIEWGLRGNFIDVPLDCPQRSERLGWTGDALAFAPTSLFIADSHAFWAAWLQSIREEQFDNHGIPVVVPNEVGEIVQSGWSDAAVTIPWDVYWRTGDTAILADNYTMMQRWILYHQSQLQDGISHMWTVGDWLQPYSKREDSRRGETDHSLISTAFYARSLDMLARTAKVLNKLDDQKHYQQLFEQTKQNFQQYFFDKNGRLQVGEQTQTSYLLGIGFDLLDDEITEKATGHLLGQIEAAGGHLRTGFLGTPLLAPVLEKVGRADVAFDLVFKQSYPSWLFSVSQGATTMWERWDGYTRENGYADKQGSLNHYAYGAIGRWLYERMAGIRPLEAGYKRIHIAPLITDHLSHVQSSYQTPYGQVSSKWRRGESGLEMDIDIPVNTRATIVIPYYYFSSGSTLSSAIVKSLGDKVFINGLALSEFSNLGQVSNSDAATTIEVEPGVYRIRVTN